MPVQTVPPGPVNTDPDYTPPVLGTAGTDPAAHAADRQKIFYPPRTYDLPSGWQPSTWYTRVSRQLGVPQQTATYAALPGQESGDVSENWQAALPDGVGTTGINTVVRTSGRVAFLQCLAQGFAPSSAAARAKVLADLQLCADADFPGNAAAAAGSWIPSQASGMLDHLATMSAGEGMYSATPAFGSGRYLLRAQMNPGSGPTLVLYVYGSEP